MGDVIGILSTVILVSTVCTLIFAVGAYIAARRHRDSVNTHEDEPDDLDAELTQTGQQVAPRPSEALFRRAPSRAGSPPDPENLEDDTYVWK